MLQIYDYYLNHARKMGEMFYKVSYNQGFCSLLGFGSVLKKKSQYLAEELGIVTLLFVICVYSKIITKS